MSRLGTKYAPNRSVPFGQTSKVNPCIIVISYTIRMAFSRKHFCNAFRKGRDLVTGLRMKVLDYIDFHIPIFNTMNHLRFF